MEAIVDKPEPIATQGDYYIHSEDSDKVLLVLISAIVLWIGFVVYAIASA